MNKTSQLMAGAWSAHVFGFDGKKYSTNHIAPVAMPLDAKPQNCNTKPNSYDNHSIRRYDSYLRLDIAHVFTSQMTKIEFLD